jgi:hypothetical protein
MQRLGRAAASDRRASGLRPYANMFTRGQDQVAMSGELYVT